MTQTKKLISDSIYTLLGDQTGMFVIISQSKSWALPGRMRAHCLLGGCQFQGASEHSVDNCFLHNKNHVLNVFLNIGSTEFF